MIYPLDLGLYELFLDSDAVGSEGFGFIGISKKNLTEMDEVRRLEVATLADVFVPTLPPFQSECLTSSANESCSTDWELREYFNETYSILTFLSSCRFYNAEKLEWSSEGCRVRGAI